MPHGILTRPTQQAAERSNLSERGRASPTGARQIMRKHATLILVWSAIVCLAATPAWAQYGARPMSDPATGETYHVEIGGYFWDPTPNIQITSQSLTRDALGTPINFVTDLGIEKTKFRQVKMVLRPGRKHRLRFEYTPITYDAVGNLKANIVFNGIRYPVTFPITTDTSVLPAADQGGNSNANAQASGAYFSPFSVDPLDPVPLNKLAPQEELGNFVLEIPTGGNVLPDQGSNLIPDEEPPAERFSQPRGEIRLCNSMTKIFRGEWEFLAASETISTRRTTHLASSLMILGRTVLARCCCLVPSFLLALPLL